LQQPVLLLKLDTEGAELSALQGLAALLEARQASAASVAHAPINFLFLWFCSIRRYQLMLLTFCGAEGTEHHS
jgi:hypothetical protein